MPCTKSTRPDRYTHQISASRRYVIVISVNRYMVYKFLHLIQFLNNKKSANADVYGFYITPRVGLEPTTTRLTAECSTIELSRINKGIIIKYTFKISHRRESISFPGQALDRLVAVSSMHCCTSTPALSTLCSSRGLTSFWNGISHLEGGFTLRCLQRLSRPDLATLWCAWQRSRYTRGPSIPVLSY